MNTNMDMTLCMPKRIIENAAKRRKGIANYGKHELETRGCNGRRIDRLENRSHR